MVRIEESIQIETSPTDVFNLCHDLARRTEWDERVVGVEMITPAPIRRASLIRIDAGRAGQFLFTWEGEYINYQFPSSSTLKVIDAAPSSPFKAGTESWEFSRSGGGTQFSLTWEYQPRGFLARIADVLGRRATTRRAIRRSLANLKTLIEAG